MLASDPDIQIDIIELDRNRYLPLLFHLRFHFLLKTRHVQRITAVLKALPYQTLPEEKKLLDLAYELYNNMEDSNTAYNVTLDLVIDETERRIQDNRIATTAEPDGNKAETMRQKY